MLAGELARAQFVVFGAGLMIGAAAVQAIWGTAAERQPLESVARPLNGCD